MLTGKKLNGGFTLLETVISMIVASIIGVIAVMGFLEMGKGYNLSKKNAMVTQQAQITMARIKKELASVRSISCGSDKMITFKIKRSTAEFEDTSTIYLTADNKIQLKTGSDCSVCSSPSTCINGDTLAENVSEFSLGYCKDAASCSSSYPDIANGYTAATVVSIKVILKLIGYGDTPIAIADPDYVVIGQASGS